MAELWPAELEDKVDASSFQYNFGETTIRSDNDVGPAKVRRRFTKGIDTATVSFGVTSAQYLVLEEFYKTTLAGGAKQFEFAHPITGVVSNWRIVGPPSFTYLGGVNFSVSMTWEKMPS